MPPPLPIARIIDFMKTKNDADIEKDIDAELDAKLDALANDELREGDEPEFMDVQNPYDQAFWDEFFQVEDLLEMTDELDPPNFSVTVQNHRTGETKTYNKIHLQSTRKKIAC